MYGLGSIWTIVSGAGDRLDGGWGQDTLTGSGGKDAFVFPDDFELDAIDDFEVLDANDRISVGPMFASEPQKLRIRG